MPSDTPTEGRCNYLIEDDNGNEEGYCLQYPRTDEDGEPIESGLCDTHREGGSREAGTRGPSPGSNNAVGNDDGTPEGNTRAMRTGQYMTLKKKLIAFNRNYGEGAAQMFKDAFLEYKAKMGSESQAQTYATLYCFNQLLQTELINEAMETAHYTEDGTRYKALDTKRLDQVRKLTQEVRMGRDHEGLSAKSGGRGDTSGVNVEILMSGGNMGSDVDVDPERLPSPEDYPMQQGPADDVDASDLMGGEFS